MTAPAPFATGLGLVIETCCAVRDALAERLRGGRCPVCDTRYRLLAAHVADNHLGEL